MAKRLAGGQKFNDKQQVKGGVLKRSRRRAKSLGREGALKGGVTGQEARSLKRASTRFTHAGGGGVGGVRRRALDRVDYLREHGGVPGGVHPKNGISRPEARKIRRAYMTERRLDPLHPLSGREVLGQAEALTNQEFMPQEQELVRQRQMQSGRTNVMASWFDQYQQQVASLAQQQQAGALAAQQQALAATQQAFAADTAGVDQRQGQAQQGAANVGGGQVDPSVYAAAQQAAGARQQQGINFGGGLAQIGAANTGLMNQRAVGAAQQRTEALTAEQARSTKIDQLAQELAQQRGATKAANVTKVRDAEHTKAMERNAFGLDVQQEANDAAQAKSDDRRDARQDAATRRNNRRTRNETNRHNLETESQGRAREQRLRASDLADDGKLNGSRSGGKGAAGKYTQSQKNGAQEKFRSTRSNKSMYSSSKKFRALPKDQQIAFVAHKEHVDPLIVRAALAPGSLSSRQRQELRRMGVKVKRPTLMDSGKAGLDAGRGLL